MALFYAVVLGFCLGLVLGGSPARLGDLRLRGMWLLAAAIGLQVLAYPSGVLPWQMSDRSAVALQIGSYACLVAIAILNRRVTGFPIAAAGMASNLAAIAANGGHMPALRSALADAGRHYHLHNNSMASDTPHLGWLVDRWAAPGWLPLANVYSVGDVLLVVGTVVVVCAAMGARLPRPLRRRSPTGAAG